MNNPYVPYIVCCAKLAAFQKNSPHFFASPEGSNLLQRLETLQSSISDIEDKKAKIRQSADWRELYNRPPMTHPDNHLWLKYNAKIAEIKASYVSEVEKIRILYLNTIQPAPKTP